MIRRLVLFLFFLFFWLQAGDMLSLDEANYLLKKQQTNTVSKAYKAFKNIRVSAIMNGDLSSQKAALEGIISSGKLLHINVSKYVQELDDLGKESKHQNKLAQTPAINFLHQAYWKRGEIVLSFKHKLLESQINYFILDKKFNNNYRYVFDIKSHSDKELTLSKLNLTGLRLNQNSKSTLRLVIENSTSIAVTYVIKGRDLIIRVGKQGAGLGEKVVLQQNEIERQVVDSSSKRIVIDPGHGGKDGGAVGYRSYREKIIVFEISQHFRKELEKMGYKVFMTRDRDTFIELRNRTKYANKKNADLFISIHANSVPKKSGWSRHRGLETYFLAPSDSKRAKSVAETENTKDVADMNHFGKESFLNFLNKQKILASNKLAIDLQKGMLSVLRRSYSNIRDGGVRKGPFWVLVGAQMPAVLVEVGFVSNPKEARNLVNETYQKRLAHGLALGVRNYFKIN